MHEICRDSTLSIPLCDDYKHGSSTSSERNTLSKIVATLKNLRTDCWIATFGINGMFLLCQYCNVCLDIFTWIWFISLTRDPSCCSSLPHDSSSCTLFYYTNFLLGVVSMFLAKVNILWSRFCQTFWFSCCP